jgi:YVTN family beta-propeller protein
MKGHRRFRMLAATRMDFPVDPAEEAELERHLAACSGCRTLADQLVGDQGVLATVAGAVVGAARAPMPTATTAPTRVRVRPTGLPRLSSFLAAAAVVLGITFAASVLAPRLRVAAPSPSSAPAPSISSDSFPPSSAPAPARIATVAAVIDVGVAPVVEPEFCPGTGSWDCVLGIVGGAGAIWATNGQTVIRIDPATNTPAATIDVGSDPRRIVVDGGFVWVTVAAGDLVQIDPATNTIKRRIPVGAEPAGLASGGGDLWVVRPASNQVVRVNPATGKVTASIDVPARPWGVAVGAGSAWVASYGGGIAVTGTGGLTRIDTTTNRVVHTTPVAEAREVVVALGSVWVAGHDEVSRLDAASGKVTATQYVGNWPNLVAMDGSVWISSAINSDVRRWNVATDAIDGTFSLGPGNGSWETALAIADGDLWLRSYGRQIYRIRPIGP